MQDAKTMATNNSAANFMARISDSTFVVAFYEAYSATENYNQRVEVGIVNDNKLSFSESVVFGKPNNANQFTTIGQPQGVFNTSNSFTIPWFVESNSVNATESVSVGLCLSTYTVDSKSGSATSVSEVCKTEYDPAYYMDSTKLSDTQLAFVFVDRANNYALTVATVEFSDISGSPTFRGSYVLDESTGAFDFGAAGGFYPKPTVRVLDNNLLAIGFMNPSNTGKPSIKVLKYSSDLSIDEVSPTLPISNADFSIASADPKAFNGIVMDMLVLESGFVVAYAGNWANTQQQRLSFVESLGKPVGIVTDVSGSDLNIATTGTIKLDTKLTAGEAYYASTDGKLYLPSTTTNDGYVLVSDNSIVLSKDSRVGVAITDSKLFVTAAN